MLFSYILLRHALIDTDLEIRDVNLKMEGILKKKKKGFLE